MMLDDLVKSMTDRPKVTWRYSHWFVEWGYTGYVAHSWYDAISHAILWHKTWWDTKQHNSRK